MPEATPPPRRHWLKRAVFAVSIVALIVWMVLLVRILLNLLAGPA
jgi:hypothetical protein